MIEMPPVQRVSQALILVIKDGMKAEVRPSQPAGTVHTATVSVIDKVFDAASDTFGVRPMVPNPMRNMPAGVNCTATFPFLDK